MPDFSAKMHQIQFRLGLCPRPHWGSPLGSTWLGGGIRIAASSPAYVPKEAMLSSHELVPPLFRPTLRPCRNDYTIAVAQYLDTELSVYDGRLAARSRSDVARETVLDRGSNNSK